MRRANGAYGQQHTMHRRRVGQFKVKLRQNRQIVIVSKINTMGFV